MTGKAGQHPEVVFHGNCGFITLTVGLIRALADPPRYPLFVHASLENLWATINNAMFFKAP